ncbi:SIR2 family protein [Priestia endophytica]|uniref:SIR2 family protein n=1 Tax=Priestia endophytica TaxID=135735 RepID=UPI000F5271A1|nr:SIR2 family protein [Priestia endophytica]RPK03101.1 hypothetical protein FH5_02177 [Priestia endophytica]
MEFSKRLSDLLNNNELQPSKKGYYLEKSVILLFENFLKEENQIIFTNYRVKDVTVFDALIPKSFGELLGPIAIEIKTFIRSSHLFRIKESLKKISKDTNIKSLLLVSGTPMTETHKLKLMDEWTVDNNTSIVMVIWDINDLERNLPISKTKLSNNISFSYLKSQTQESKDNKPSTQKDNLQKLKEIYKNEKIVLFLGSGVSKECNLPLWHELIGGLSSEIISNFTDINYLEKKLLIKELSDLLQGNPLISASYLEIGLLQRLAIEEIQKEKYTFYTKLKEILYKNYKDNINKDSQLYLIAQAIVQSGLDNGMKSVITYNYDDILQKYLRSINSEYKIQSNFNDSPQEPGFFSILHPHGFLPFNENDYSDYSIEEQEIIFTEDSYHKLQADPYSWRNLIQINAFRDDIVVMLGLSVNDPNLRRLLLHTSQKPERKHFAFLQRYSGVNSVNLRDLDYKVRKEFLNIHHRILEENFEKLGVNIIWYDNHSDLPKLLANVFSVQKINI